ILKYPGSISNGVREMVSVNATAVGKPQTPQATAKNKDGKGLHNVQMNNNSYPPLPQNETAVATSTDNAFNAVAASNDYVSGGNTVMTTLDGGDRKSTRLNSS